MLRVVSQDGKIDVPYERYTIWCYKDQYLDIYHIACDSETGYRRLAEYSTEAKAIKAMEMLREAYLLKAEVHSDYNRHHYKAELNKVFRFPQDDEIEV